jgi:transcriptional regulator with XRE-family HTH domain
MATTRLERFIHARGLLPAHVARASGVARSRLQLWRSGKSSPMLTTVRKLVQGMREMTGDPTVKANDLFPLDDDE